MGRRIRTDQFKDFERDRTAGRLCQLLTGDFDDPAVTASGVTSATTTS